MAKESSFSPEQQATNTSSNVVTALERLSEAFRVLLWQEAKQYGISPIQVQILTYLLHYPEKLKTVTHLASHFNMTKATISDAIKTLESKGLIRRKDDKTDSRSHSLHLTRDGKLLAKRVETFANPMQECINSMSEDKQAGLLEQLMGLIQDLNRNLVITPQRMCFNCRFYEKKGKLHYCSLVNAFLRAADLKVECPEFRTPVLV